MVELSLKAWAFMILSMLAVQPEIFKKTWNDTKIKHIKNYQKILWKKYLPYWEVTIQHGELTRRLDTTTFSTFLSRMSFMTLHKLSYLALSSSRFFFSSSSSGVEKKFVKLMIYAHLENKLTNNLICTINIELLSYLEVQGPLWWLKLDFCHHTPLVVEQHTHRLVQSYKWPQILFLQTFNKGRSSNDFPTLTCNYEIFT